MKSYLRILCLLLAIVFCFSACNGGNGGSNEGGNEGDSTPQRTEYNIVFALATIPPVMAALDCIESGRETYAIIERGKTYSGIEAIPYFHNAGFDTGSNLSAGFTETEFEAMVNQIKALKEDKEEDKEIFFHIYVQDGTALMGAALAANAGLTAEEFHVYMCEDGTLAYDTLRDTFVAGKTVTEEKDEVYDDYLEARATVEAELAAVLAKTDNAVTDEALVYNMSKAFALASLEGFTYYLQDEALLKEHLESAEGTVKTKLLSAFGMEGYEGGTAPGHFAPLGHFNGLVAFGLGGGGGDAQLAQGSAQHSRQHPHPLPFPISRHHRGLVILGLVVAWVDHQFQRHD